MTEDVPRYDELKLRIARGGSEGGYQVAAFGGDGSSASGGFMLPFDQTQLENFVLRVGRRRGVRAYRSSQMEDAKSFGSQLFDALVTGGVRDVYLNARRSTEENERGLRVTLYLTDVPELMEVPWEFLYDRPSFLSQSVYTPVVRSLDLKNVRPPRKVNLPLRILGVVSQPHGFDVLDVGREREKLGEAVSELQHDGLVEVGWLERATLADLDDAMSAPDDVHVLHYVGHGAYDDRAGGGILVLEDARGLPHMVTGEELGSLIQDERSLRLVVLNSCEGARGSHADPFSAVASSLVEYQIPAVIGMQFEITDEAAVTFAGRLYSALARGFPVDAALAQARKAMFASGSDIEFGTPVLFLRAGDARLFALEHTPPPQQLDEEHLTISLEQRHRDARPGEAITWELTIENSGAVALRDVTARDAAGNLIGSPIDLPPGRQQAMRWTEPLEPGLRQLVTVTANDPRGSSISEQVTATSIATTRDTEEQAGPEAEVPTRPGGEEQGQAGDRAHTARLDQSAGHGLEPRQPSVVGQWMRNHILWSIALLLVVGGTAAGIAVFVTARAAATDPCLVGIWKVTSGSMIFSRGAETLTLTGGQGELFTVTSDGRFTEDTMNKRPFTGSDGVNDFSARTTGLGIGHLSTGGGRFTFTYDNPSAITTTFSENGRKVLSENPPASGTDRYTCANGAVTTTQLSKNGSTTTFAPTG